MLCGGRELRRRELRRRELLLRERRVLVAHVWRVLLLLGLLLLGRPHRLRRSLGRRLGRRTLTCLAHLLALAHQPKGRTGGLI